MIKVLFFIQDLSGGGAEKVLVNLVNNMDHNKFEITLLTLFDQGVNKQYLKKEIHYKYVFKNVFRGNQHLLKLFSPKYLFKKTIRDEHDIVISYMQGATTRIVSGNTRDNTIIINWIHNELTKEKLARSYRSYEEFVRCYTQYDATVFVAESAKEVFEKETRLTNNNIVKYNTVESDMIIKKSNEGIEEIVYDKGKINLITVGSLTKQKGYDRLLRIINKIAKADYNFHLFILGHGPLKEQLERYVKDNKLDYYVTFLGYKANPYNYVKNADLFICSSYHEGYSTVVTESLIVGTPVITTLCSGMEEMLGEKNEYGIIVDNNEEALYEGVKELLDDSKLLNYYKIKAQERSKYFSTKKTVMEIENMLINMLTNKNN